MAALEDARSALAHKLHTPSPGGAAAAAPATQPPPHVALDPYRAAIDPAVDRHPSLGELPRKRIVTQGQLTHFENTQVFRELLGFIRICNTEIRGRWLTDEVELSEVRPC